MKDFYRTAVGKKFFDVDIPTFITALKDIAESLKQLNLREEKKVKLDEKLKKIQIREAKDPAKELKKEDK